MRVAYRPGRHKKGAHNEWFSGSRRHQNGGANGRVNASGRRKKGGDHESFNPFNGDRRRNGSRRLVRPLDHEHRDARVLGEYQPDGHARLSLSCRRVGTEALRASDATLPVLPIGGSRFNGSQGNRFFALASTPFFGRASAPFFNVVGAPFFKVVDGPYFEVVDGPYFEVVEDPFCKSVGASFCKGVGARSDG
jgi:hypothetical protein